MNIVEEKKIIAEEGPRIEKYLKYNYKNIEKITYTDVIINPTGIPHIKGYVNNNRESSFDAGVYDEHFEGVLNWDDDKKRPIEKKTDVLKTVSEIEKEKK